MPQLGDRPGGRARTGLEAFVLAVVVYGLAGRLALLLAIPPGYATAVWPAAGLALALTLFFGPRILPAIWLGSFLVNATTVLATDGSLHSALVAASIGVGAALQALAGAWLVRRHGAWPNPLDDERSILRFLVLGGPIGCCVGASWGIATLIAAGALPLEGALRNWSTWWVGDTIGVIIFAPLALLLAARSGERREGRLAVTLTLCLTFAVSVTVFAWARRAEDRRVAFAFEREALELSRRLERATASRLEMVEAAQTFFASVPQVDRRGFRTFVEPMLERHPGVQALEWVPRVPGAERARVERAAVRDGLERFGIRQLDEAGRVVPAPPRSEHFPVYFVEPRQGNDRALGFDLASDPARRRMLERARDRGAPVASAPIRLVQEPGRASSFLLCVPLYAGGRAPDDLETRRERLRGFVIGAFRIPDLVDAALADASLAGVSLRLFDASAEPAELLHVAGGRPAPGPPAPLERVLDVAGRRWLVRASPTRAFVVATDTWSAWAVLAGGLFLTGLLGALLLVVTARTRRVARIAADLNASNARLESSKRELELLARELDDFAQIVSHDLRAPLRGIRALAEWIAKDHEQAVGPEGREQLELLQNRAARMQDLIEGVLRYSRAARSEPQRTPTDAGLVVAEVVSLLDAAPRATVRIEGALPTVLYDPTQLQQVFQNLIQNAIQHHPGEHCEVVVSCRVAGEAGDAWEFSVQDDGPGIEERHFERIFKVFKTLRPADEVGTVGVGLSIVKKIVERNGGTVSVRSNPGAGAEFLFTVPRLRPSPLGDSADVACES